MPSQEETLAALVLQECNEREKKLIEQLREQHQLYTAYLEKELAAALENIESARGLLQSNAERLREEKIDKGLHQLLGKASAEEIKKLREENVGLLDKYRVLEDENKRMRAVVGVGPQDFEMLAKISEQIEKSRETYLGIEKRLFKNDWKSRAQEAQAEVARLNAVLGRVVDWTHQYGKELCPPRMDTYGEGVRDSKDKVAGLLMSECSVFKGPEK